MAWRSVACSVYGALGWDPCGVHNVCSVYEAFGLALLVAFRVQFFSLSKRFFARAILDIISFWQDPSRVMRLPR